MNAITDCTTPLTKEEMAMFYMALSNQFDDGTKKYIEEIAEKIKISFDEKIEEIKSMYQQVMIAENENKKSIQAIKDDQQKYALELRSSVASYKSAAEDLAKETTDKFRKQLFAAVKPLQVSEEQYIDPVFHSSKTPNEEAYWLNHEKNVIDEYVLRHNYNKGNYYNFIYQGMQKDGYDVNELLKKYRKTFDKSATVHTMISKSDVMRLSFSNWANKYIYNERSRRSMKAEANAEVYKSIVTTVGKLSKTGHPSGTTYHKAYKLAGIDPDKYMKKMKQKYNITNCNVLHLLSIDKKTAKIVIAAVNKYLEENANG